jgi:osmotically-inducible protein OsmY
MKTAVHLQRDVLDELNWEPGVDAEHIGVTVNDGVVTLTGHVPVYSEKHTAGEVAKRVYGVRAVANEIEVRPSDAHVRDDEDVASAAVHALQWDSQVPDEHLQVTVEQGWLDVEGTVEHPHEKAAVDRVLRHLTGVRGITNSIMVVPKSMCSEIQASIEAALRRSATLSSRELAITVDGPKVILTGDVHSHAEREEVERTAWTAGGVIDVHNCVTVTPWGCGPAEEWGY